jgi:hypothetical protein
LKEYIVRIFGTRTQPQRSGTGSRCHTGDREAEKSGRTAGQIRGAAGSACGWPFSDPGVARVSEKGDMGANGGRRLSHMVAH